MGGGGRGTSRCGYLCRIWTCRRRLALPILAPAGSSARLGAEGQMKASLTSSLSRLQGRIVPLGNHVGTSCSEPQAPQVTPQSQIPACFVCCMCTCNSTELEACLFVYCMCTCRSTELDACLFVCCMCTCISTELDACLLVCCVCICKSAELHACLFVCCSSVDCVQTVELQKINSHMHPDQCSCMCTCNRHAYNKHAYTLPHEPA